MAFQYHISQSFRIFSNALASLALMIVSHSLTDRDWISAILHVSQFSNHPPRSLSNWNIFLVTLVILVRGQYGTWFEHLGHSGLCSDYVHNLHFA